MPTIRFVGRVVPELPPRTTIHPPPISIRNMTNGLSVTFAVSIEKSVVIVEGDCNRFKPDDLGILVTRATDLVNSTVDLISFYAAAGFRVVLETVTLPSGQVNMLLPTQPHLQGLCTAYSLNGELQDDFVSALQTVATTPELFLALNDLIAALISTHQSAIAMARSLETLRNMIAKGESVRAKQWEVFRASLNLTADYLAPILTISVSPRHGRRTEALDGDMKEVARRMWIIMDRALLYEIRGRTPLSLSEFPCL